MKPRASPSKRGVFRLGRVAGRRAPTNPNPSSNPEPRQRPARLSNRVRDSAGRTAVPIRLIAFNKPYGVICQFSREADLQTLADFVRVPDVYPAGRLDTDSEGLLLLTNHGPLQHWISSPASKRVSGLTKTYWAQVEGEPDESVLARLCAPLDLGDFVTAPSQAKRIAAPLTLWPRTPPIRQRASIPTAWIELTLVEGKNRQVRRMTAKTGYPPFA